MYDEVGNWWYLHNSSSSNKWNARYQILISIYRFSQFYFSVFSLVLVSIEGLYQTLTHGKFAYGKQEMSFRAGRHSNLVDLYTCCLFYAANAKLFFSVVKYLRWKSFSQKNIQVSRTLYLKLKPQKSILDSRKHRVLRIKIESRPVLYIK